MNHAVIHKSFVIDRVYPVGAERVFHALSDPVKKRRWFAEGDGFLVDDYTLDFRVGGFERVRFRAENGPPMTLDSVYLDIVTNLRIVFAYAMTMAGEPFSSSLGTMELVPVADGILLRFTEHTAFVNGEDGSVGRREGSLDMLRKLAEELENHG